MWSYNTIRLLYILQNVYFMFDTFNWHSRTWCIFNAKILRTKYSPSLLIFDLVLGIRKFEMVSNQRWYMNTTVSCSRHIWRQLVVSSRRRLIQKGFCRFITQLLLGTGPIYSSICSLEIFFITVQLRSPFFPLNRFRNALFKCTKWNLFWNTVQLYCKLDLLVFCASMCNGSLVWAIKHFVDTFLETFFSSLLY